MKTQPELDALTGYPDPRHADGRDVYPALQTYQADSVAADSRHDHILRAALLATGHAFPGPRMQ